jgi:AcrR family transcriptional regulator
MAVTTPTLRQQLKQETRLRLEQAALELFASQGYRDTSIGQIVEAAGTTRTTFYDHFRGKSDLIHVVQEREIAPALIRLCERLDSHDPITRAALRAWLDEYARVWRRIRVYFDAYSEASRTDAGVAGTILPNSYAVTSNMRRFLARFEGADLAMAHDKLVLLFNDLDQLMHVTSLMHDAAASRRMLEAFTDLHWRGLFQPATLTRGSRRPSGARAAAGRSRRRDTVK